MRFACERKAVAAAVLAFYMTIYLLNALLGPPPFSRMFYALALVYGTGFFGLVAGWFWARWYALGVGFSGAGMAALAGWQVGLEPLVLVLGGTHLVSVLVLVGQGPASLFDGRKDWRARWRMDDDGATRLGKSITRAGASLPYLIIAGLAPKPDASAVFALLFGALGLWAVTRMKTWGLVALAASAVLSALSLSGEAVSVSVACVPLATGAASLLGAVCGLSAVLPFAPALASGLARTWRR
jgi:hypothetical protein